MSRAITLRTEHLAPPAEGSRGRNLTLLQPSARPAARRTDHPLGVYVHIPFCVRKCHYCDFNSGPASDDIRDRYVEALTQEIRNSPWAGQPARTVFFGGGTPSELNTDQLRAITTALQHTFNFTQTPTHPHTQAPHPNTHTPEHPYSHAPKEWTIECNPGTVTAQSLAEMREMGFNRISLGVQSFHEHHLHAIGRIHTAAEAEEAVALARDAGFRRLNVDLIFCLPDQTLAEWKSDLERAFALEPEHISLYNLTIEENTEFGRRYRAGLLSLPDEDLSADMYEWAIERTAAAGMEQYEVSNFAYPGEECRHNQVYWRQEPYIGFGLSAASYAEGVRWTNTGSMQRYLQTAANPDGPELAGAERLSPREAAGEAIMLGLRTREGADLARVSERHGVEAAREWSAAIAEFVTDGLMMREGSVIRLTRAGVMLANAVCTAFL